MVYLFKMVIFYSYVSLPEGINQHLVAGLLGWLSFLPGTIPIHFRMKLGGSNHQPDWPPGSETWQR